MDSCNAPCSVPDFVPPCEPPAPMCGGGGTSFLFLFAFGALCMVIGFFASRWLFLRAIRNVKSKSAVPRTLRRSYTDVFGRTEDDDVPDELVPLHVSSFDTMIVSTPDPTQDADSEIRPDEEKPSVPAEEKPSVPAEESEIQPADESEIQPADESEIQTAKEDLPAPVEESEIQPVEEESPTPSEPKTAPAKKPSRAKKKVSIAPIPVLMA